MRLYCYFDCAVNSTFLVLNLNSIGQLSISQYFRKSNPCSSNEIILVPAKVDRIINKMEFKHLRPDVVFELISNLNFVLFAKLEDRCLTSHHRRHIFKSVEIVRKERFYVFAVVSVIRTSQIMASMDSDVYYLVL